ncbi:MAG: VacB/RNase II family 3'-5' exoribonuclease [Bdellovibrionota bacterium]
MPRKNKKGARGAKRRSQAVREIEKLQSSNQKRKKSSLKSSSSTTTSSTSRTQGQRANPHSKSAPHAQHQGQKKNQQKGRNPKAGEKSFKGPQPSRKTSKYPPIIEGRLDINPNGFAFVIPDNPEYPHVYIPQGDFREYMNRDKVQAKITRAFDDGKVSGILQALVKHQQTDFIGSVRLFAGGRWVIPFDARDRHLTFEIEKLPDPFELKNNQTVLCKVIEYPTKSRGKVEILQAVDDVEKASHDTLRVLVQAAWPREFSEVAVQEAKEASNNWEKRFGSQLQDLTDVPFVTIDGADARDFDDAVYASKKGRNYELWVAIADVSRFVIPGSRLNDEAYSKSTSVYFPDHVVPMLPEVLSNGTCSINPLEPRPSLGCKIEIDENGETVKYEFFEAKIISKKRMTYEEMEDWIEKKSIGDYPKELNDSFENLLALTHILLKRRKKRGGLDLDIPEARVFLNKDGSVRDIQVRQRLFAHRLIEECMLAANRSAANFLHIKGPSLFRVHEKPNPRKVEDLFAFLSLLGITPPQELEKTEDFAELLELLKNNDDIDDAKRKAVNSQILRSMAQARYTAEPLGHFALNEIDYTHFTSPIRRYPDLVVHRLIRAHLENNKKALLSSEDLAAIGRHTSDCERQAIDMERKVIDIKKCRYVEKSIGEDFKCFVTGITEKGLFCQIQEHFVDGLLESESLARKAYYFDGSLAYRGPHHKEITYGAELILRLAKVDVLQGRINFGWGGDEE